MTLQASFTMLTQHRSTFSHQWSGEETRDVGLCKTESLIYTDKWFIDKNTIESGAKLTQIDDRLGHAGILDEVRRSMSGYGNRTDDWISERGCKFQSVRRWIASLCNGTGVCLEVRGCDTTAALGRLDKDSHSLANMCDARVGFISGTVIEKYGGESVEYMVGGYTGWDVREW
ncbi:hypothetical protein Tco_0530450 [Tanacetum coccineum]